MSRRWILIMIVLLLMLGNAGCMPAEDQKQYGISMPTVPATPQMEPVRFIVLGDSRGADNGVNSTVLKKLLKQIKKLKLQPEFVLMPGDLTNGTEDYAGTTEQLQYFREIITEYYPAQFYYPGIGNHEMLAGADGEKAFSETFADLDANFCDGYGKTSYYFDAGDTRFFMLNSDHTDEVHRITGSQLDWLKANIDQSKKYHVFLMHEPPYPTGAGEERSLDSYPEERDAFWEVVDGANGAVVFCGHEHNYSRRLIDKSFSETIGETDYDFQNEVYQIVSGGAGAPPYTQYTNEKNTIVPPVAEYHFTIVDIDNSGMKVQAVNIDGEIIDAFRIP